ncbi:PEP-CTERM sorting domain-containing protein [Rugamonas sp. FT82W]|uniref:PEP-CTERM sorting domain-containing protein n=1 Tax=Duganella vulcania TaxID=2692166 RepID=A0A845FZW1_9BURK|nr:CCXG family PEP-CTERM protein [Duganella vulcania]MYM86880.1 PEP-CTERM sorting domain-containing protein [Duganella vulcania]
MKSIKFAAVALALAAIGSSNAAVITFQTGSSGAGSQASAQDYRSVVDAAVAGGQTTVLSSYDNVSNNSVFGTGNSDIAFKSTIDFGLSAAGTYSFRAGVDFGRGGAVFLDGQAVALNTNDMWWNFNYNTPNGSFLINNQALSAGNHTLTIYGLEGCCDGGQQVQYAAANGNFQSFSADTLAPAVPEPETSAMLLGGLALVGGYARRRINKA